MGQSNPTNETSGRQSAPINAILQPLPQPADFYSRLAKIYARANQRRAERLARESAGGK